MTRADRDSAFDQAVEWVSRMDSGIWSTDDENRLQCWLRESTAHHGALLQAEAAWLTLDREPVAASATPPRWAYRPAVMPRRRLLVAGGAAIAASFAAGFGFLFRGSTFETHRGEMIRTPLADGSIAAINTDSKMVVQLEKKVRLVQLARGEAWFQVVKDRDRPFVVEAGSATIVAVGTAFSVRRNADSVDVLVTEGIVRVSSSGNNDPDMFLSAGDRATLRDAVLTRLPSTVSTVDQALAWRDGKIDLSGESLKDAVAEFNRYNRRQIVVLDPAIGDERLDGIFRTEDVEGFAEAVHNALGVPVNAGDADQIWIGKRPIA